VSRVNVSYIGEYDSSVQRRLLSTGIHVLFVVEFPVEDTAIITSIQTLSSTITTSSINTLIASDTSLASSFPNGVIAVNSVEVTTRQVTTRQVTTPPAIGDTDSLIVGIIAAVSGAVFVVIICICVFLCCCRSHETNADGVHVQPRLQPQLKRLDYKIQIESIFDDNFYYDK
jgi:hypothetical protein